MYGGGAPTLYENLKENRESPIDLGEQHYLDTYKAKDGVEVAQIYIDKYFKTYEGVAKFIRAQKRNGHKLGYVKTLIGRKRRLPDINSGDFKKVAYSERLAVNATIQGSAADIAMNAQNKISKDEWFKERGCFMIGQVHDEIFAEVPEKYVDEAMQRMQKIMAHPFGEKVELNLPLRADSDKGWNYSEAK